MLWWKRWLGRENTVRQPGSRKASKRRRTQYKPHARRFALDVRPQLATGLASLRTTGSRAITLARSPLALLRNRDDAAFRWRGSGWHPSKLLSALLLVLAAAGIGWLHGDERWFVYREDVRFDGLTYLNADALYDYSAVEGTNTLWVRNGAVRAQLIEHPYVAEATVHAGLPSMEAVRPDGTTPVGRTALAVTVEEIAPVALWQTDDGPLWLLDDGTALEPIGPSPAGLLTIVDGTREARTLGEPTLRIRPNVLHSAQVLHAAMPAVQAIRYSGRVGLNFALPNNGGWIYWGNGEHAERKLANLDAMQQMIRDQGAQPQVLDLRYIERPYFR